MSWETEPHDCIAGAADDPKVTPGDVWRCDRCASRWLVWKVHHPVGLPHGVWLRKIPAVT